MKKEKIYVVIDSEEKRLRAIQILSDAGEESLVDEFTSYNLQEDYKYLHCYNDEIDKGWFIDIEYFNKTEITLDQLEQFLNTKEIKLDALKLIAESYGFELVEKKQDIKIGDFGKFWDLEETNYFMGFVKNIRIESAFPFIPDGGVIYRNFRHLTDEEKKAITENW